MTPKELITQALIAQERASAPYSNYPVGAALLTENNYYKINQIISGEIYVMVLFEDTSNPQDIPK